MAAVINTFYVSIGFHLHATHRTVKLYLLMETIRQVESARTVGKLNRRELKRAKWIGDGEARWIGDGKARINDGKAGFGDSEVGFGNDAAGFCDDEVRFGDDEAGFGDGEHFLWF
nr:hypothetical protein CFP56_57711 [Quercus suber]